RVRPVFARVLNTRSREIVGDIKYIWEVNRHQHLSALAYSADGARAVPYILRALNSWLSANSYLRGVNWTSSLEIGLRVISWSLLYPRIASALEREPDLRDRWLRSFHQHLRHLHRRPSRYSSANNHRIGELAS